MPSPRRIPRPSHNSARLLGLRAIRSDGAEVLVVLEQAQRLELPPPPPDTVNPLENSTKARDDHGLQMRTQLLNL